MGEEQQDPQRAKRIAAAAYDYDSDPRWADYWSNVLIPPNMAARSDVVDHYRRKFYQSFVDPDFVVEAISSTSSSQSSSASERASSQSTARNVRPQSSGSGSGTTGAAASTGRSTNAYRLDQKSIHFSVNAWVLVVALLGMLPVVPRNLSIKSYRLSLLGTACSSAYSLYTLYGKPRGWNLPAIQTWFQTVIGAKDFIHLIYCITLVSSRIHSKLALVPVFCWAADHVARFLRRNFARSSLYRQYMEEPCIWVEGNATTLNTLCSNAEIALGFLLIFSLFSWQRNVIQTFIYWQLLKLMYHAPVTAGYHQSAWAQIGRTTSPYISQYAPFLNRPIAAVQRWWFR